jgi:Flp pilus assembly protein TadD
MRRTLAIAAALTLSLSACGTAASTQNSQFKGEQQNVVKVVDSLAAAGTRGDAAKICKDILAKQLVTELKTAGGDCETEMDRAISDASDYDLQVTSVKVNGANATAQVRQGKSGQTATFTFVKEGGAWKASALGAS